MLDQLVRATRLRIQLGRGSGSRVVTEVSRRSGPRVTRHQSWVVSSLASGSVKYFVSGTSSVSRSASTGVLVSASLRFPLNRRPRSLWNHLIYAVFPHGVSMGMRHASHCGSLGARLTFDRPLFPPPHSAAKGHRFAPLG
ncbi:hypothetical protein, unlikely [Trypanosoma congolense IL3000]|uniref:Uncharacterized protein n=1 Tax=Trypanosoma congolense (strain IL3000) TaxID=1068625 RepID=F9WFX9_TRYCI|nr:hypothetical protein, unlikely [Trypanosoma congolense IL3000]